MPSETIDCLGDKLDKVSIRSENRAAELNEGGHVGQLGPVLQQNASSAEDIQGEFASIRDSVTNVKLPADVRLNDAS